MWVGRETATCLALEKHREVQFSLNFRETQAALRCLSKTDTGVPGFTSAGPGWGLQRHKGSWGGGGCRASDLQQ